MADNRIEHIYRKCLNDTATVEEREEFIHWLRLPENEESAKALLFASFQDNNRDGHLDELTAEGMIEAILLADKQPVIPAAHRIHFMRRWWVAACAVLLVITASYLWYQQHTAKETTQQQTALSSTIEPGREGAILTLGDGSELVLDSLKDGLIATQNGAQIVLANGQLKYDSDDREQNTLTWNTISTPKGRQFNVTLPDGTRVWMNAASSVKYPTFFAGNERRIEVTGEVYFEVTHDKTKPFIVTANTTEVQVYGTSFNINAYPDQASINTTLLNGSVRVRLQNNNAQNTTSRQGQPPFVMLKPGQQLQVNTNGKLNLVKDINIGKVMAWKNGFFNFEGATLKDVMNQLIRWYNIEVRYEGEIPEIEFFGEMSRNVSLRDVLKSLEDVGVRFRIENERTLIVLKK